MGTQNVDVHLHDTVFTGAIELYGCGTVPTVLALKPFWRTPDERAEFAADVERLLAEDGLLIRKGELVHTFEDALHTVGRPDVALYGWLQQRDKVTLGLFVGRNGQDAVTVAKGGDQVVMVSADYRNIALEMNKELPSGQPGRGRSYTFPESEARWNWVDDKGRLSDGSSARSDAFKAAEVIMAPRDAAAQMYGLVGGEKSPIKLVILWLRGYGLWTVRTHLDGDTEPWVTVAPASDDSLTASLAELITD